MTTTETLETIVSDDRRTFTVRAVSYDFTVEGDQIQEVQLPPQAPVVTDETTSATQEASEPSVATMAAPTRGFVPAVGTWSAPPTGDAA